MHPGVRHTAEVVRLLGRADGDAVVANLPVLPGGVPEDVLGGLRDGNHPEPALHAERRGVVVAEGGVQHPGDGDGRAVDLGADGEVVRRLPLEGEPALVEDGEGGASPLSGLADDDVYRLVALAETLALGEDDDLGVVQLEADEALHLLVVNVYLRVRPELEVVFLPEVFEHIPHLRHGRGLALPRVGVDEVRYRTRLHQLGDQGDLRHLHGDVLHGEGDCLPVQLDGVVGEAELDPLPDASLPGHGVVFGAKGDAPYLVLLENPIYRPLLFACHSRVSF